MQRFIPSPAGQISTSTMPIRVLPRYLSKMCLSMQQRPIHIEIRMQGYKTYTRLWLDKPRAECGDRCCSYSIGTANHCIPCVSDDDHCCPLSCGFGIRNPDEKAMRQKRPRLFFIFLSPDENFRTIGNYSIMWWQAIVKKRRENASPNQTLSKECQLPDTTSEAIETRGSIAAVSP